MNQDELERYKRVRDAKATHDRELRTAVYAQRVEHRRPPVPILRARRSAPSVPVVHEGPRGSEFGDYLDSPQWAARRARYFKTHPRRCRICRRAQDRNTKIHLLHVSTEHVGDEPDGDLVPLCKEHVLAVFAFHQRFGGAFEPALRRYLDRTVAASGRTQPL